MNLIEAIIGGGVAGAATAGALIKIFLHYKLEKSQIKFQQILDQEKEERRSQLEVLSATQKVRPISFEQKNIEALEVAYAAVAKTALPRHNFRKVPTISNFDGTAEQQITSKYFHLFSENFNAFSSAFEAVNQGFQRLEDHAIYLERELEIRVIETLKSINSFYQKRLSELSFAHQNATSQFQGNIIPQELKTFNFEQFHTSMILEWSQQTTSVREELKALVRSQLKL